jgi:glycosyltransferase involved in cell wall biosynthesis
MRIAIHACDLDSSRIDGTRVYLHNILKWFGQIDKTDEFFIYHGKNFNKNLTPVEHRNYFIRSLGKAPLWTQSIFAYSLRKDEPGVLWMPVHNMPIFKSKKIKSVVTIHDLAFKYFPQHFPKKDLFKLNLLAWISIKRANHIIAISESTKKDILKFFPKIKEEKITVIYHGFDAQLFQQEINSVKESRILENYEIKTGNFLLYVGAIQPRKNLEVLVESFEEIKKTKKDLKLVLAGAPAWMHHGVLEKIKNSKFSEDIVITGTIPFEHQPVLYQNASVFVFPSLYEGFGIPVLEAMASGVPVICSNNSSLPEVAANAALYFEANSSDDLKDRIISLLDDQQLRQDFIQKGKERVENFSWKKCAEQTLEVLKNTR